MIRRDFMKATLLAIATTAFLRAGVAWEELPNVFQVYRRTSAGNMFYIGEFPSEFLEELTFGESGEFFPVTQQVVWDVQTGIRRTNA